MAKLTRVIVIMMQIFAIFIYLMNEAHAVDLRIYNGLENQKTLQIHCKSKDDDLGVHQLMPGEFYHFHFLPRAFFPFFGSTLFFCGFVFDNTLHWYNIYDQLRDRKRCPDTGNCFWLIKETGPCLLNMGYHNTCDFWNK